MHACEEYFLEIMYKDLWCWSSHINGDFVLHEFSLTWNWGEKKKEEVCHYNNSRETDVIFLMKYILLYFVRKKEERRHNRSMFFFPVRYWRQLIKIILNKWD